MWILAGSWLVNLDKIAFIHCYKTEQGKLEIAFDWGDGVHKLIVSPDDIGGVRDKPDFHNLTKNPPLLLVGISEKKK